MASTTVIDDRAAPLAQPIRGNSKRPPGREKAEMIGTLMLIPYFVLFVVFVIYPVCYGLWIARHPSSYVALASDPIYKKAIWNTLIFLFFAINIKMILALVLSGFFSVDRWWVKALAGLFILPWALPSIPTILSFRFMLNPEWGIINSIIFKLTLQDGPNWLNNPTIALGSAILVHVWKSLPFWTIILLSGRLAISKELYEAAAVDGAGPLQRFRHITWPSIWQLYVTCAILSTIWTLGDFNSVYLLTGGGPADLTHVLATLGVRYLRLDQVSLSMAAIVTAMPLVLPLVFILVRRLSK